MNIHLYERNFRSVVQNRKFELKVVGLYFRFLDDREREKDMNTEWEDVHIDGLGQNSVLGEFED